MINPVFSPLSGPIYCRPKSINSESAMCNTKNIISKGVLSIILKGKMEKKIKLFYPQGKFYSIPSF